MKGYITGGADFSRGTM